MKKKRTIGVDLGGTNVRVGLIEGNKILNISNRKISSAAKEDVIINEIIDLISPFVSKEVSGIGVGVPSIVDVEKGIVHEVHNIPSWRKVYLKDILEDKFSIRAEINNDVNCFVLGEKFFGKGKQFKNIVGLAMGTGLGGGIILDNKLYSGMNGGAGEFGLIKYLDKNYEFYCSGQFFKDMHGLEGEKLLEKAKSLNKKAIRIFEEFGEHVGIMISAIMYSLNPEIIILGGSVSSSYKYFKNSMLDALKSHEFKVQVSQIKIQKSTLKFSAVLGAAKLCEI